MSTFFSGSLNPYWPHIWLLGGAIIASFAVAIGIVLENPKWSLANVLVVGGVAIEAVCTLLLFGFDEGISDKQQSHIIALDGELKVQKKQTTDAETHLAELRKRVGPRTIDGPGFLKILGDGPRASVEIVYAKDDPDAYGLALIIGAVLRQARWSVAKDLVPKENSEILKLATSLPSNVFIEVREITQAETQAVLSLPTGGGGLRTPYSVLAAALLQSGIWLQSSPTPALPIGTLRVIIAPKP